MAVRALRELIELDDVGHQFDRRKGLGKTQDALRLVEQLGRVRRHHLSNSHP